MWRKRAVVLGVVALLAAGAVVPGVSRAEPRQTVAGRVLAPTAGTCDQYGFIGATLMWGARLNGVTQYLFEVDGATHGSEFTLSAVDSSADVDITFIGQGASAYHHTRGQGETGIVPSGATLAWVCAYSGAAVDFVYTAG